MASSNRHRTFRIIVFAWVNLCSLATAYLPVNYPRTSTRRSLYSSTIQLTASQLEYNYDERGDEDEEGFDLYSRDMQNLIRMESSEYPVIDDEKRGRSLVRRVATSRPFQWISQRLSKPPKPGKLILLRCGQSEWNANGTFTGELFWNI